MSQFAYGVRNRDPPPLRVLPRRCYYQTRSNVKEAFKQHVRSRSRPRGNERTRTRTHAFGEALREELARRPIDWPAVREGGSEQSRAEQKRAIDRSLTGKKRKGKKMRASLFHAGSQLASAVVGGDDTCSARFDDWRASERASVDVTEPEATLLRPVDGSSRSRSRENSFKLILPAASKCSEVVALPIFRLGEMSRSIRPASFSNGRDKTTWVLRAVCLSVHQGRGRARGEGGRPAGCDG